ncbi:hypothetical protein FQV27_16130 [Paracoccus aurantiacus]|uniref:O-antigen ligase family protein n=1 Tax=Paracoccus aurantiacus TaxID=2599412 RepID=A0A5C6RWF2_9RHOB|nr:hypothetical protein [Paracoccus aurantiacus]TXB66437.1 hypothetical protein FQV27_16130 [Paracoccus aurantiacus]
MTEYTLLTDTAAPPQARHQSLWRAEMIFAGITVFLSPINYLRADFAYVTASDVFAMMTLILMYVTGRIPLHPFGRASKAWYCSVFLLIFGLLASSAVNGDLQAGLEVVAQYCFSLMLIPLLFLQRPRAEVLLLIKIFVLAMVFVMLHGAWYMEFAPKDFRFVTPSGRLSSLVERENAAGALAALAITFSMWMYFTGQIRMYLLLILIAPLGYGLLLTGSNTGFFLTAIGMFSLALFSGALRLLAGMVVVGFLLFFVIYNWGELFLPEIFIKRVLGALETGNLDEAGTFSDRMFLIHEAYGVTRDTILLGLGANQYRLISAEGAPVHNTYLLLLAEGGLISLLGHFGMMMTGLLVGLPVLLSRKTRWYGALTITTIVMLALVQNGLAHFYARFWAVPWFLAISLSLIPDAEDEEPDDAYEYP